MKIKVSIPVIIGGNTGQREQWESYTKDYYVSVTDNHVVLNNAGARYSGVEQITFDLQELLKAVEFIKEQEGDNNAE